ncbi:MAG: cupin domain-containing protein [Desulfosarcinaceae bacterium]|jgi:quercetin dioxygenase-like cupin family protein
MTAFQLQVISWPSEAPLTPEAVEARMQAEDLPYYRWSNGPGDVYGVHHHGYHKIIYVVSGSIIFNLPQNDRQVALSAGDRLALPAGTAHGAVVGPEGVVCLEAHQPVAAH